MATGQGGSGREAPGQDAYLLTAWAKVNLYLHVVGRRADGYHELDSLVVFAGVGDRIALRPGEDLSLTIDGPFGAGLAPSEDNLALRAARALKGRYGVEAGARIALTKSLPLAAGIGGGSADAAAVLHGLAALWGLTPEAGALEALGAALGADVPVCLFGQPAFVAGIGERIERAPPLPPAWLLLAQPGIALSTPAVFEARQGGFSAPAAWGEIDRDAAALAARLARTANDLEEPARGLVPQIGGLLDDLAAQPGCLLARMSGSGATCFGLFGARAEAEQAADALSRKRPGQWILAAPLLHGRLERPWWPLADSESGAAQDVSQSAPQGTRWT